MTDPGKDLGIQIPKEKLEEICAMYHVRYVSIFGSVVHGDSTPDSDLDVLAGC